MLFPIHTYVGRPGKMLTIMWFILILTALWHELLIKASHYSLAQTSHYTPEIAFVHYHTSYEVNTQDLIYHRKVRGRKHVTKNTINIV